MRFVAQYAWSGEVYGSVARKAEQSGKGQDEDLPLHKNWLNTPTYFLYWTKMTVAIAAYVCLGTFLAGRLGE